LRGPGGGDDARYFIAAQGNGFGGFHAASTLEIRPGTRFL